ncbi:MAG TPA: hypothetical protein VMU72_00595 [Gaiellaceae bacterium]|nr:hypothetical protein [Gaiellaceae bacterium]
MLARTLARLRVGASVFGVIAAVLVSTRLRDWWSVGLLCLSVVALIVLTIALHELRRLEGASNGESVASYEPPRMATRYVLEICVVSAVLIALAVIGSSPTALVVIFLAFMAALFIVEFVDLFRGG